MNNLKTNLIGVLSLVLIFSLIYFSQNNNERLELNKQESAIINKNNLINKNINNVSKNIKAQKDIIKKELNKIDNKEKIVSSINKNKINAQEQVTKNKNNKFPTSLEKLTKDLKSNRNKLKFPKDESINYLQNEKSDPYSKPLMPQDIDRIKEIAAKYEPTPVLIDDIVTLETNRGTMKLKLFSNVAPKHCYNFKKLANSGFYDGTTFHRIIPNFMIQGGDIFSRDGSKKNDGQGGPGWTVDAEFNNIKHTKGVLSMARSSDPNSAGSQFFICHANAPHLDGKYTAFGEVIDNIDVVDKIVNAPTEYSETKKMCAKSIPVGEDVQNWIELLDPKTRKKLYAKVPQTISKSSFKYEMNSKLRNNNPSYAVRIISIRVD